MEGEGKCPRQIGQKLIMVNCFVGLASNTRTTALKLTLFGVVYQLFIERGVVVLVLVLVLLH